MTGSGANMRRKQRIGIVLVAVIALGVLPSMLAARSLPEFTVLVETYGPAVVNISTRQS